MELDTSASNIWQIGKPQKIIFDSASTVPNAIVTDTINFYPINNISRFGIKILDEYTKQLEVAYQLLSPEVQSIFHAIIVKHIAMLEFYSASTQNKQGLQAYPVFRQFARASGNFHHKVQYPAKASEGLRTAQSL